MPEKLSLSSRYAWTVKLDNGMTVALGREPDKFTLKARVQRLVNIYPQLARLLPAGISSVDMRYQNGLALTAAGLAIPSDVNKPVKASVKKQLGLSSTSGKTKKQ